MDEPMTSLLFFDKESEKKQGTLDRSMRNDLGVDDIQPHFCHTKRHADFVKRQLSRWLTRKEDIVYRQRILDDICKQDGTAEAIDGWMTKVQALKRRLDDFDQRQANPIRDGLGKIGLLAHTVSCFESLDVLLHEHRSEPPSEGWMRLQKDIQRRKNRAAILEAIKTLPSVKNRIDQLSFVHVHLIINAEYEPMAASINTPAEPVEDFFALADQLFPKEGSTKDQDISAMRESVSGIVGAYDRSNQAKLNKLIKQAKPVIDAYCREDIEFLCRIECEFDFYLAAKRFTEYWQGQGIEMAAPFVEDESENMCRAVDVADLGLASRLIEQNQSVQSLVKNDVVFDEQARLYVLTGANRGGKTTYLRSVGLFYLLFQNGVYAPCRKASVSPIKGMFLHFPAEEKKIVGYGHLDEELAAIRSIVDNMNQGDLLLLNESLSGTGMTDAVQLAVDLLRIFAKFGVKCIYATHLHALSDQLESINRDELLESKAASLVMGIEHAEKNGESVRKRTYKVMRRESYKESFADDIAKEHGLSYEQIIQRERSTKKTEKTDRGFSLLLPAKGPTMAISDTTERDIGLDRLGSMCKKADPDCVYWINRLSSLPSDEQGVVYRQEIFDDFMQNETIISEFEDLISNTGELETRLYDPYNKMPDHRRRLRFQLMTLQKTIDCIEQLAAILSNHTIRSSGLGELLEKTEFIRNQPHYRVWKQRLGELIRQVARMKQMRVALFLDDMLRPANVVLDQIGFMQTASADPVYEKSDEVQSKASKPSLLKRMWTKASLSLHQYVASKYPSFAKVRSLASAHSAPDALFRNDMRRYVDETLTRLSERIDRTGGELARWMVGMASELLFYQSAVKTVKHMQSMGISMCRPKTVQRNECRLEGLVDPLVAWQLYDQGRAGDLVKNDTDFTNSKSVLLVTGPNRGGKTTYLRAVGMAQILYQAGLYVPANKALMTPVSRLVTHFIETESRTIEHGRFGEAMAKISKMFDHMSAHDLILMNESLSCTSAYDGYVIGKQLIEALLHIGPRVLFATHLHDLAAITDDINQKTTSERRAVSLVAGVDKKGEDGGKRTYRIVEGKPQGSSYAHDLAVRHGLTYDQQTKQ